MAKLTTVVAKLTFKFGSNGYGLFPIVFKSFLIVSKIRRTMPRKKVKQATKRSKRSEGMETKKRENTRAGKANKKKRN